MHLVYVIDSVDGSGGAERSLAAMAPLWVSVGYHMEVVTLRDRPGLQMELARAGVPVTPVVAAPAQRVQRLTRLLKQRRPDLVHTTLWEGDVVGRTSARLAGCPVVSSLVNTSYGPEEFANPAVSAWKLRGAQFLDAATLTLSERVHCVSEHVATTTARRLGVPRRKVEVIPRGRDGARLGTRTQERRDAVRASLGLQDTVPVVLAAARQEFQKGLDLLIDAFALLEVPRAVLLIAGRAGGATEELLQQAHALGLQGRVRFLGSRDDVADLMAASDVCVVPSRREGLPGTVVEAMCIGVPLVVSDIAPNREALGSEECGRIVPREPQALARAVEQTFADRGADRVLAGQARFRECFDLPSVAARMTDFHRRALSA